MPWPNRTGCKITYIEVVRPGRLVYSHGGDGDDEQFHVTVTFAEQGNKTRLTMRSLFKSAEETDTVVKEYGAVEGAKETLDRFEEQLAKLM
ncbi:SRPBCC domain-containing protein [Paenibacillus sepulcri]|uniref:SRPBCC domain-containing protein n=1 Tax=Paenibacillus sepulcri TaxID=359917 RepID=UPI0035ECCF8F